MLVNLLIYHEVICASCECKQSSNLLTFPQIWWIVKQKHSVFFLFCNHFAETCAEAMIHCECAQYNNEVCISCGSLCCSGPGLRCLGGHARPKSSPACISPHHLSPSVSFSAERESSHHSPVSISPGDWLIIRCPALRRNGPCITAHNAAFTH